MDKDAYAKLLLDPRWTERKTKILKRDNYQCRWCDDHEYGDTRELHVHHRIYYGDRMPWDYEDEDLITICWVCHADYHDKERATKNRSKAKKYDKKIGLTPQPWGSEAASLGQVVDFYFPILESSFRKK